jgi:hypothetical protein
MQKTYRQKGLRGILLVCLASLFFLGVMYNIDAGVCAGGGATVRSCGGDGSERTQFDVSEHVFACGKGYSANEALTIYVVRSGGPYHKNWALCSVGAKANGTGYLNPTDLGSFAVGKYDIWVDRDGNGWLNYLTEPVYKFGSCVYGFFVIPEFWLGTILGLVGCFGAFGVFRMSKKGQK